jgi:hypothetical protein
MKPLPVVADFVCPVALVKLKETINNALTILKIQLKSDPLT